MQHRYFAASNSSEGFKNYYPQIFERADRLYIIKGGPGTGKSSFMKKCADEAEKKGYAAERYYCSSDANSLDGVLLFCGDVTVGILDGTAPHVWEPNNPGVREEIVNLGQFWDSELLGKQKNEILSLSHKKSAAYKRAYDYLRSCGNLRAVSDSLLNNALDNEKLLSAADRTVRSLCLPDGKAKLIPAITSAVAMTGKHHLNTFMENAKNIYRISYFYGIGEMYTDALAHFLEKRGAVVRISYDPIDSSHIDGIFIENINTAFVISDREEAESGDNDKFVNSKRFARTDDLREIRGELRYAASLYSDCVDGALHALAETKVYHFLLEDIYKNAMDFHALSEFNRKFVEKIIK